MTKTAARDESRRHSRLLWRLAPFAVLLFAFVGSAGATSPNVSVSIVSPSNGQTVSGSVVWSAATSNSISSGAEWIAVVNCCRRPDSTIPSATATTIEPTMLSAARRRYERRLSARPSAHGSESANIALPRALRGAGIRFRRRVRRQDGLFPAGRIALGPPFRCFALQLSLPVGDLCDICRVAFGRALPVVGRSRRDADFALRGHHCLFRRR